jgi:hypothetical protein
MMQSRLEWSRHRSKITTACSCSLHPPSVAAVANLPGTTALAGVTGRTRAAGTDEQVLLHGGIEWMYTALVLILTSGQTICASRQQSVCQDACYSYNSP